MARARAFFLPRLTVTGTYTRRLRESTREVGGQTVVIQRFNALGASCHRAGSPSSTRAASPSTRPRSWQSEATELDARGDAPPGGLRGRQRLPRPRWACQQVYEAAEQRLDLARQSLEDAQARAGAGLASTNDVTRAELEVATAEAQLAARRGARRDEPPGAGLPAVAPVQGPLALAGAAARARPCAPPGSGAARAGRPTGPARPDILSAQLRVQPQQALAQEPLARLFPALGA